MTATKLHYIYDPLCGWCYAAAPLVLAARQIMPVIAHGGGMLAGNSSKNISPNWRDHVMPHDQRIEDLTGQPFGEIYKNVLLRDQSVRLDSEPPTTAVLAAEHLEGRGLDLLRSLHTAHYVQGRHIADKDVLIDLAEEIGLGRAEFQAAYEDSAGRTTQIHFAETRALMARVGGRGFPTFVLEKDGEFQRLDHSPYFGNTEEWQVALSGHVVPAVASLVDAPEGCGPDGCTI